MFIQTSPRNHDHTGVAEMENRVKVVPRTRGQNLRKFNSPEILCDLLLLTEFRGWRGR